jgi:hypothetical protein
LGRGTGVANGCDHELDGIGPRIDVRDVVGLPESVMSTRGKETNIVTSFMRPKMTLLELAYFLASCVQRLTNWSFDGPP